MSSLPDFGSSPYHYALSSATTAAYIALMLGSAVAEHAPDPDPVRATGPVGECWTNARDLCRSDPGRFSYVEGIIRRDPGAAWEMHGYVVDTVAGQVVETTTGYADAVAYRGIPLDIDAVDAWFAAHSDEDPRSGLTWVSLSRAIESGLTGVAAVRGWRP